LEVAVAKDFTFDDYRRGLDQVLRDFDQIFEASMKSPAGQMFADPSEEDLALALNRLPRMTATMTEEERRALIRLPRMTAAMTGKERYMLQLIWQSVQSRQIIDAMTDEERSNPDLIDSSRRTRIATNSGTEPQEVEKLLAGFDQLRAARRGLTHWRLFKMVWNTGIGRAVITMLLVLVIAFLVIACILLWIVVGHWVQ
jgi:signal recognition particle GTPase